MPADRNPPCNKLNKANPYPYPFNTTFDPFSANTVTYYFRTHFQLPGTNVTGVILRATTYVDRGFSP